MTIPFKDITDEYEEIVKIEEGKNKRTCILFIIFGAAAFVLSAVGAVIAFIDYEPAVGLFALLIGILFGGVFIFVGIKSNKPVVGICEVTVANKEEVQSKHIEDDNTTVDIDYYLTFDIPETQEKYRQRVDKNYFKNAQIGGKAYLLKSSKGKIRAYVPNKREKARINKD